MRKLFPMQKMHGQRKWWLGKRAGSLSEYQYLRQDLILFTYLHLASDKPLTDALLASGATGIAYETVQTESGQLPLLTPMSEVAGRMATQVGAIYLQKSHGGRGVLMGACSRVAPVNVIILAAVLSALMPPGLRLALAHKSRCWMLVIIA